MRSGIDTEFVLDGVRLQDDLFRHVNGRWLDDVPIPDDRASNGTFYLLRDAAEDQLREIVESTAGSVIGAEGEEAKVGALYAAFMDEDRIQSLGLAPIADDLALIDSVQSLPELLRVFGELDRAGSGAPFGFFVNQDAKQSDRYVMYVGQGGLSLPDEAYYRDDQHAEVRQKFVAHVRRMLELAGRPDPAGTSARILGLETLLAKHHWDRVSNRDATKTYNMLDGAALAELSPGFDWAVWAEALGAPEGAFARVVVRQPSFFTGMAALLTEAPLEDWKDWAAWRQISGAAPLLTAELVSQNFDFYGRTLTGAPQMRERWKRALGMVEGSLGEVLGKIYVQRHFSPAAKDRMQELVANLVEAYRQSITGLDWMGEDTRAKALAKLDAFTPKIAYPDEWRDYSGLRIEADDLVGNARRAAEFELARDFDKLGGPVDRNEWFMTPQTVNAYYNPLMNEIVFPAAILQKPFFDADADDAVNYGAIGAVIGHEIGHGFDDQGSKYDGTGNLVDWWTDSDRTEFEKRTSALIEQYAVLEPRLAPGHHVNGELTIGENIGDLGGLSIAYAAYRISLAGQDAAELDGMTGDQRFFWAWAQAWRGKSREEEVKRRLNLDPHSPEEFRCNAVVRNIDAFHAAFDVSESDALWLAEQERVRIW